MNRLRCYNCACEPCECDTVYRKSNRARDGRMLTIALVLTLVTFACATLKNVLRTVDDVANVACELFGQQHPTEFAELVRQRAPAQASQVDKPGFNVGALCDMKEVVQPFIDDALRMQTEKAASIRQSMSGGGERAVPPQP